MPPVSRRMFSTPPSMSVKFVRLVKKFRTNCIGALTLILPLNEDRTRNILQIVVSCQLCYAKLKGELLMFCQIQTRVGEPDVSSYQQRVHQRCLAFRASKE